MSDSPIIFATVNHAAGAGHEAPLPVREKYVSQSAGHAVCLWDWALMYEMEMQRSRSSFASAFTATPLGIQNSGSSTAMSHYYAVTSYMPLMWSGDMTWMDPSWSPTSETYVGSYDLFGLHGLRHAATMMTTNRPRSLDDMRRYFYDLRRCTRPVVPQASLTLSGPHPNGVNAWGVNSGSEYSYDDVTGATVTCDFSQRFHPSVVANDRFSATPWKMLTYVRINGNGLRHSADYYDIYRTLWLTISSNGVVDVTQTTSTALRQLLQDEMARHPVYTDDEYYAQVGFRSPVSGQSRSIFYDCVFPADSQLTGWSWQPS